MDAPEALREFLAYVVANLIDHPQQASIAINHTSGGAVSFRVQLAPEDVRNVIGKNGLTISSIRSLLSTAADKHGLKVSLRVGAARDLETEADADADESAGAEAESHAHSMADADADEEQARLPGE
jgi:predicted RNA-binding protein YlqC (UPF0109 family)